MFSAEIAELIGYYVYLLLDGNDAFYVGKGRRTRAFQHAADELQLEPDETPSSAKLQRIRSTRAAGREVDVVFVRIGIPTEEEAYRLESVLIDLFRTDHKIDLTNIAGGHHADTEGLMRPSDVIALYDTPPIDLGDMPVIMFRIPRLWRRGMNAADLYEATRGWWRVDPHRARQAKYVLAVSKGVVREVYSPFSWRHREQGEPGWSDAENAHPRYGFEGHPADGVDAWRNKNVLRFLPPGFQGTHRYHNC